MLQTNRKTKAGPAGGRYVIVASRYNARYVDGMLRAARKVFKAAKAARVTVIRVPGAFEIPMAASKAAGLTPAPDAILCLGVIWQGQTTHAQHIAEAVTRALMSIALESGVPVIHEVLTVQTEEQARERCLHAQTNRGVEGAQTAIAMAATLGGMAHPAAARRNR